MIKLLFSAGFAIALCSCASYISATDPPVFL